MYVYIFWICCCNRLRVCVCSSDLMKMMLHKMLHAHNSLAQKPIQWMKIMCFFFSVCCMCHNSRRDPEVVFGSDFLSDSRWKRDKVIEKKWEWINPYQSLSAACNVYYVKCVAGAGAASAVAAAQSQGQKNANHKRTRMHTHARTLSHIRHQEHYIYWHCENVEENRKSANKRVHFSKWKLR